MKDEEILGQIRQLVAEEHALRDRLATGEVSAAEGHARIQTLEESLDRCWDQLRHGAPAGTPATTPTTPRHARRARSKTTNSDAPRRPQGRAARDPGEKPSGMAAKSPGP